MNLRNLRRTVQQFRSGLLGKRPSDSMCMAVCLPLQSFLGLLGVKTKLVEVDFETTNHCWLELEDGRIIDPTADQFSGPTLKLPKVYIGHIPQIYRQWMSSPHDNH